MLGAMAGDGASLGFCVKQSQMLTMLRTLSRSRSSVCLRLGRMQTSATLEPQVGQRAN